MQSSIAGPPRPLRVTPYVRRNARARGIDLTRVIPANGHRILLADLDHAPDGRNRSDPPALPGNPPVPAAPPPPASAARAASTLVAKLDTTDRDGNEREDLLLAVVCAVAARVLPIVGSASLDVLTYSGADGEQRVRIDNARDLNASAVRSLVAGAPPSASANTGQSHVTVRDLRGLGVSWDAPGLRLGESLVVSLGEAVQVPWAMRIGDGSTAIGLRWIRHVSMTYDLEAMGTVAAAHLLGALGAAFPTG